MTPAKRRPATPASKGPSRVAPDVPTVADPPPVPAAETKDGSELLGPDGEPIAEEVPARDASRDSAPRRETRQVDAADRATTQSPSPGRPLDLYPLPVWPD